MRDVTRIGRIAMKLLEAWRDSPDLRLGQLVESAGLLGQASEKGRRDGAASTFYVEDDRVERGLDIMLAEDKNCKGGGT